MSSLKFETWKNLDGTENYKCRAWVNFNGTGTVAIRASGNVSSITDNGAGDYTVNFIVPMIDANYTTDITVGGTASVSSVMIQASSTLSTNSFNINTLATSTSTDSLYVCASIFR